MQKVSILQLTNFFFPSEVKLNYLELEFSGSKGNSLSHKWASEGFKICFLFSPSRDTCEFLVKPLHHAKEDLGLFS